MFTKLEVRILTTIAAAIAASLVTASVLKLSINTTASMPIGLYQAVDVDQIKIGDLVAVKLKGEIEDLAVGRGYKHKDQLLLKRIVAAPGDTIDVQHYPALPADLAGLIMPKPKLPLTADPGMYFVAGDAPRSFDSRYFGLIGRESIKSVVRPIWTL